MSAESGNFADISPRPLVLSDSVFEISCLSRASRRGQQGSPPGTVAKVYRLLQTIMSTAVDDGLLRVNPVSIKGAAVEEFHERPALAFDDVARLADGIEPRFRALVWTAATSALRARRHVDLDRAEIRVERALTFEQAKGPVFGPPKPRAADRTVVVPATTTEILRAHIAEFVEESPDALIFTSVKGSPLLNCYFAPMWTRAKKAAGVDRSVRVHDLRHLAASQRRDDEVAASEDRIGRDLI